MTIKCTQFRIARPTDQMAKLIDFYKNGLGLTEPAVLKIMKDLVG